MPKSTELQSDEPSGDGLVIIADTKEKKPLWREGGHRGFRVKYKSLKTGDYTIEGLETLVTIERKASVHEIYGNFTNDRDRFMREIERMKDIRYRFIMIEEDYETVMDPKSYKFVRGRAYYAPNVVLSSLIATTLFSNVHVVFVGKNGGRDFVRRTLKKCKEYYDKGKFDDVV